MTTPDQLKQLYLSGTVMFPTAFPALADVNLEVYAAACGLPATDSLRVTDSRGNTLLLLLKEVTAVFIPDNASNVDFSAGRWLIESEIAPNLVSARQQAPSTNPGGKGIVFVPETARVLSQLEVGTTAAEIADSIPATCCP